MQIIVLSDIHGNLPALHAVLDAMPKTTDLVIVAGDSVGFGPQQAETLDLLRRMGCILVKGNVDDYVADSSAIDRLFRYAERVLSSGQAFRPLLPLEVIRQSVEWSRAHLGQQLDYVRDLPFSIAIEPAPGRVMKVVHANPYDLERPIVERSSETDLTDLVGEATCDLLVFGHSHSPFQRRFGTTLLVDAASLGFPTDGRQEAPYTEILFADGEWRVQQHRVPYQCQTTEDRLEASDMPVPLKEAMLKLLRTARRVRAVLAGD